MLSSDGRLMTEFVRGMVETGDPELSSDGRLMTEFVRGMVETGDPEKAAGLMFERSTTSTKATRSATSTS